MSPAGRIALAAVVDDANSSVRARSRAALRDALPALRLRFESDWLEPLQAGEPRWTALLRRTECAFDIAVSLRETVWPARVRVAVASIEATRDAAGEAAERAHIKAARLLDEDRDAGWFRIGLRGRGAADCAMAEACARLHGVLTSEWTAARSAAVRTYRALGRQAAVARQLGITQQAVSQKLHGARFQDLLATEEALRTWLREAGRSGLWAIGATGRASGSLIASLGAAE
ncbi:MAG TPA: hypothetical protein VGC54_11485 [Planctomycetota bacterium]